MSKYYKDRLSALVVKYTNQNTKSRFEGIVVIGNGCSTYIVGYKSNHWEYMCFEPYTPTPQELAEWGETETLINDNPKDIAIQPTDVEIRLRCLEMACERLMDTIFASEDIVIEAQEFYDWITKKD